jgi:hypothetical protein
MMAVAPFAAMVPGLLLRVAFVARGVGGPPVLHFAPELLTAALVTGTLAALVVGARRRGEAAALRALLAWPVFGVVSLWFHGVARVLAELAFGDLSGHGRPLRRRGRLLRASVAGDTRSLWAVGDAGALGPVDGAALRAAVPAELREDVAAEWRETAVKEHAAIAAFARHALHLVAIGAPPALVASAAEALQEEIAHAGLAFAVAAAVDGAARGPGPFPEATDGDPLPADRRAALRQIACEALLEGELAEGASVRLLARLRGAAAPPFRRLLARLAREEAKHVRHARAVVAFCLAEAPELAEDLRRAALAPVRLRSSVTAAGQAGTLRAYGIQAVSDEEAAFAAARNAALAGLARREVSVSCTL